MSEKDEVARELRVWMAALDPTPEQVERMWNALAETPAAAPDTLAPNSDASFAAEWLELLSFHPAANAALVAAAAVLLYLTTPLGALPVLFR